MSLQRVRTTSNANKSQTDNSTKSYWWMKMNVFETTIVILAILVIIKMIQDKDNDRWL